MNRIIVLVLASLLVAAPALAQPRPTAAAKKQASQLYEAGTQHFNLGEYEQAIARYKDAYRVVANPYFLYNIAQAYRRAGDSQQALSFYKSFLNALPDAPIRAEVEARIEELEAALRSQTQASTASPTAPVSPDGPTRAEQPAGKPPRLPTPAEAVARLPQRPAPEPTTAPLAEPRAGSSSPLYKRWWFWVGVGVLAAGASTAAVMASGDDGPPDSDLGNYPVFAGGFR